MGNENCPVLLWIDNMTIVHWEWMTAVALELGEQHRMNECYKFFQNGPLFHRSLYQPKINTCQFFTISANLASLDKPLRYQRPQSASGMSLLSGFATAVKCQVKMPRKIYTAPQQKKGQEMVTCLRPDKCELTSSCLLIHGNTASAPLPWHQLCSTKHKSHLRASYSRKRTNTRYATWNEHRCQRYLHYLFIRCTSHSCLLKKSKGKSTKTTQNITTERWALVIFTFFFPVIMRFYIRIFLSSYMHF